jgi:hypothetical protein
MHRSDALLEKALLHYQEAHRHYSKYDVGPTLLLILADMCDLYLSAYSASEPFLTTTKNSIDHQNISMDHQDNIDIRPLDPNLSNINSNSNISDNDNDNTDDNNSNNNDNNNNNTNNNKDNNNNNNNNDNDDYNKSKNNHDINDEYGNVEGVSPKSASPPISTLLYNSSESVHPPSTNEAFELVIHICIYIHIYIYIYIYAYSNLYI